MNANPNYFSLAEAGRYIAQSTRWMRRHWPDLAKDGVSVHRVPKNSIKGRLMVERASLDAYLAKCRVSAEFGTVDEILGT